MLIWSAVLWSALLMNPLHATAAEPAADQPPAGPPARAQEEAPATAPQQERPANGGPSARETPEVFVPSEEISEDFTVSFPVDI
jgi:hypothetical protein